ncbi:MAG TPA: hypothetical protein VKX25_09970 [Bryobacteraceae bacterium]|nr:hypothetical protein [Bryobacteraceae bacterium]
MAAVLLASTMAAEDKGFRAGPASSYPHQESEKVTIGAKPYTSADDVESAFGKKIDFGRYGVVPVLVVVENKREKALDMRELEASLVATDGRQAKAVPPEDLPFLATEGHPPNQTGVKLPVPVHIPKKNPLNSPEIAIRAFSAKMLAPGDSASGFFYFEAKPEAGDKLYVNGLKDARSQQELLYFEFGLGK